jgi:hypothetical protein
VVDPPRHTPRVRRELGTSSLLASDASGARLSKVDSGSDIRFSSTVTGCALVSKNCTISPDAHLLVKLRCFFFLHNITEPIIVRIRCGLRRAVVIVGPDYPTGGYAALATMTGFGRRAGRNSVIASIATNRVIRFSILITKDALRNDTIPAAVHRRFASENR